MMMMMIHDDEENEDDDTIITMMAPDASFVSRTVEIANNHGGGLSVRLAARNPAQQTSRLRDTITLVVAVLVWQ